MKRRVREIAKTLDAWVAELQVEENGWRTDAEVKGVIRGIEKGNTCSLEEILRIAVRETCHDKWVKGVAAQGRRASR